ncbi:hypothetical protein PtrSN002B_005769 [Pyrenophora tritici-repentis]|uniref:TT-ORF1 multi-domain protein n=2 Tax=Pyrenophora tritici-repentis TaxID=45151 RepID=A0A2W1DCZ2_9PLEO|nr:uncharacterized protein PTRG_09424 [Pyrenophora tritici-repentis Pt-1C-BFP]KAA8617579.1 hypothetical protein PtrV1_09086 [Pyrenophora tritici-repentis]EDU42475.1 predicted protein [Pyrenophora tritici-repentis Pt-1C-BFP]KAF7568029.1 TT-ORF1 multi-domain protein [Pyrenophora tritici-repentis]KAI0587898.1 hypothetical protein Alg215_01250 [Pyrenophora tritici-repentis]KAI1512189.1 hypothetical protein Ptr86124_009029 [Pyrenophora tritici-repentis]
MTKFHFLIASEISPGHHTGYRITSASASDSTTPPVPNPDTPLYTTHRVHSKSPCTKKPFTFTFRTESGSNVIRRSVESCSGHRRIVVESAMNKAVEDLLSKSRDARKSFQLSWHYKAYLTGSNKLNEQKKRVGVTFEIKDGMRYCWDVYEYVVDECDENEAEDPWWRDKEVGKGKGVEVDEEETEDEMMDEEETEDEMVDKEKSREKKDEAGPKIKKEDETDEETENEKIDNRFQDLDLAESTVDVSDEEL